MLLEEFKYYKDNKRELLAKYEGKFLVIKGKELLGVYDSEMDAYNEGQKKAALGSFLIQHCLPGKDADSQTFHSRAGFM